MPTLWRLAEALRTNAQGGMAADESERSGVSVETALRRRVAARSHLAGGTAHHGELRRGHYGLVCRCVKLISNTLSIESWT